MERWSTGLPDMRPTMWFLFVGSGVCPPRLLTLTSGFLQIPPHDGHSCLRLTLPTAERVVVFHHLVVAHAGRTEKRGCLKKIFQIHWGSPSFYEKTKAKERKNAKKQYNKLRGRSFASQKVRCFFVLYAMQHPEQTWNQQHFNAVKMFAAWQKAAKPLFRQAERS